MVAYSSVIPEETSPFLHLSHIKNKLKITQAFLFAIVTETWRLGGLPPNKLNALVSPLWWLPAEPGAETPAGFS